VTKPTELDQPAQGNEDWRKIAEEICQELVPERIIALSQELIELLDKKKEPARVIEMRMRRTG
jgi:hypothetical protein